MGNLCKFLILTCFFFLLFNSRGIVIPVVVGSSPISHPTEFFKDQSLTPPYRAAFLRLAAPPGSASCATSDFIKSDTIDTAMDIGNAEARHK